MTPTERTEHPAGTAGKSVEEIQADLQQTREQMAETVDALTAKLDVKARAGDQLAETKERATQALHDSADKAKLALAQGKDAATDDAGKPTVEASAVAAAVVAVALVVAVLLWRRRR
ncbi:hypothetical protein BA895_18730 [Humibacillus sp. DSM 29435]|uniref:DUF3618 domain-containing protein n=1 Tax=Humibacillus sp. DSM 29435 TaxID=1869167 RepID=UPI0008732FAC|nr:DUF3618 domain-containing protein [Humibacillus sp. DSM 29435]OFE16996.1 hypothetical protein BA895_18730 [Humibacillus sp. DSM 29435]